MMFLSCLELYGPKCLQKWWEAEKYMTLHFLGEKWLLTGRCWKLYNISKAPTTINRNTTLALKGHGLREKELILFFCTRFWSFLYMYVIFMSFICLLGLVGCLINLKINCNTRKLTWIYRVIKIKKTTVAKLKLLKFGTLSSYDTWIFLDVRRSLIHRPRKHKSC